MRKFLSLLAGGALLALAGTAYAGQPIQLSSAQMDNVTAGAVGLANAGGLALGDILADTVSQTSTNVVTVGSYRIAIGQAASQALAASLTFQAAAISHSDTAASWP